MIFLIILLVFANINGVVNVPENFSGSPEVFSGYLPDKEKYVEAFTYHEDCVVIEGGSRSVSKQLSMLNTDGTFK